MSGPRDLVGPEVVVRGVVSREPALQRCMRMGELIGVNPLQFRMVDGELQSQVHEYMLASCSKQGKE